MYMFTFGTFYPPWVSLYLYNIFQNKPKNLKNQQTCKMNNKNVSLELKAMLKEREPSVMASRNMFWEVIYEITIILPL